MGGGCGSRREEKEEKEGEQRCRFGCHLCNICSVGRVLEKEGTGDGGGVLLRSSWICSGTSSVKPRESGEREIVGFERFVYMSFLSWERVTPTTLLYESAPAPPPSTVTNSTDTVTYVISFYFLCRNVTDIYHLTKLSLN